MSIDSWAKSMIARHEEQVAKGMHDSECEYGPRIMQNFTGKEGRTFLHMCHCAKRRRIATGRTKVPGPLIISNPTCPGCWREVSFDGDCFVCYECSVQWSNTSESDPGEFVDDYGDLGRPVVGEQS